MNLKKAFTLIELLVVIAIIAILAAILFPVFAQAKASAKNSVSLSNTKQISLASIMYQGDADDMFPMGAYSTGSGAWWTWARTTDPYRKNFDLMYSPLGGPKAVSSWMIIFTEPNYNWIGNWQYFAQYGMNVSWLNPADGQCDNLGASGPNGSFNLFGPPISSTSVVRPADTVYFVDAGEDAPQDNVGSYIAYAPGTYPAADVCTWEDWGLKGSASFYFGGIFGSVDTTQAGGVKPRYTGGANIAFVDGHSKSEKLGTLAKGTDWAYGKSEGQTNITDRTVYQWGAPY